MHKRFYFYKRRFIRAKNRQIKSAKKATHHPFAIPVFAFSGLLIVTIAGFLVFAPSKASQQPGPELVIISHDHVQQVVPSIEPTVGKLLAKLDIKLHQGDVVEPSLSTPINQYDFRINIYRAVPVEIVDNGQDTFTFSAAATPRAIAAQAGINVNPADYVDTVPATNFLKDGAIGEQVIIYPATPITLNLYGTPLAVETHAKTVGALIKEKNIHLSPSDQVYPSLSTPIQPNMQVSIIRHGIKITTTTQAIAMPVDTVYDNSLAFGTSATQQQGAPGQEVITYQLNLSNGVVVSQTPIQTIVTVPPVTQIVLEGTNLSGIRGDMALAGISPSDYQYASNIISNESGWCPTKWQGEIGYCPATYSQIHNPYGSDPSGIEYGYGLCQSTPAAKMSSFGSDWATNPITQLEWCNSYAVSKYGGWANAWAFWSNPYHHYW